MAVSEMAYKWAVMTSNIVAGFLFCFVFPLRYQPI